jgi:hypothetical protein
MATKRSSDPLTVVAVGLAISLGIGLAAGAVNGLLVVGLGVHPFIITLGTMWIVRGIAFVASGAESILLPTGLTSVAKASLGFADSLYPVPMLVMLAIAAVGSVFLTLTVAGRHVFAVGGNAEASRFSGVPIGRVKIGVFVIRTDAGVAAFMGRASTDASVRMRPIRLYVCVCGRGRRESVGREGQRGERTPGRPADRPDSAVNSHPPLRSELRMDHHRLRDYHRRRSRPGERALYSAPSGAAGEGLNETWN